MDNQEQHDNNAAGSAAPGPAISAAGAARRRFARSGIGASGVILTLASQPGMATSLICKTPSGSLSGGLQSQPGGQAAVCNGLSPGYWKKWNRPWPSGVTRTTKFFSVFPGGGTSLYQNGTMLDMLTNNDPNKDPYNLAMHLVATYLNVLSGKISFLKVTDLTRIWHDFVTYGHYVPSVNVSWDALAIKIYLEKTHD